MGQSRTFLTMDKPQIMKSFSQTTLARSIKALQRLRISDSDALYFPYAEHENAWGASSPNLGIRDMPLLTVIPDGYTADEILELAAPAEGSVGSILFEAVASTGHFMAALADAFKAIAQFALVVKEATKAMYVLGRAMDCVDRQSKMILRPTDPEEPKLIHRPDPEEKATGVLQRFLDTRENRAWRISTTEAGVAYRESRLTYAAAQYKMNSKASFAQAFPVIKVSGMPQYKKADWLSGSGGQIVASGKVVGQIINWNLTLT